MKHKSLGVIQIDLPKITLDDLFNNGVRTDITSLLSEEQKSLIRQALKGEKLVYINCPNIEDNDGENLDTLRLVHCNVEHHALIFPTLVDDTNVLVNLYLYEELEQFYIYC